MPALCAASAVGPIGTTRRAVGSVTRVRRPSGICTATTFTGRLNRTVTGAPEAGYTIVSTSSAFGVRTVASTVSVRPRSQPSHFERRTVACTRSCAAPRSLASGTIAPAWKTTGTRRPEGPRACTDSTCSPNPATETPASPFPPATIRACGHATRTAEKHAVGDHEERAQRQHGDEDEARDAVHAFKVRNAAVGFKPTRATSLR